MPSKMDLLRELRESKVGREFVKPEQLKEVMQNQPNHGTAVARPENKTLLAVCPVCEARRRAKALAMRKYRQRKKANAKLDSADGGGS